ncbi:MAG: tetratricopeptide repeat protein, partial [Bacteroidota bacterium]
DFKEVIAKNPDSPAAYTLLGDAYLNLDNKFEAKKSLRKALELDPEDRKAIRGLKVIDDFEDVVF